MRYCIFIFYLTCCLHDSTPPIKLHYTNEEKQTECVKDISKSLSVFGHMTKFIACIEEEPELHSVAKWCLWSMILVQILCNEQFFVTVYFKLEKTFSSHFKWTLVPRSSTRLIKMLISQEKVRHKHMIEMLKCKIYIYIIYIYIK